MMDSNSENQAEIPMPVIQGPYQPEFSRPFWVELKVISGEEEGDRAIDSKKTRTQIPIGVTQLPWSAKIPQTFRVELKAAREKQEGDRASHTLPAVDPILHEDGG